MAHKTSRKDFDNDVELEREFKRVEALTNDELEQELRDMGIDPEIEEEHLNEIFFEALFKHYSKLTPPGHS